MIRRLSERHVSEVVRLHVASLSGLLPRLGSSAAAAYYRGAVRTDLASAFVAVEGDGVRGFVFGSAHPDQLRHEVLRKNPMGLLAGAVIGFSRQPSSFPWLIKTLRRPGDGQIDTRIAELTYLVTDARHRRLGIGRRLVDAFDAAMREQGVQVYELSVDADNSATIAFYERLGFQLVREYREFGALHRRYRMRVGQLSLRGTDETS